MGALTVDTDDYKAAVKKLNGAEREVKNSLRSRIWNAGKPLADQVIRDGPESMPSRGGLRDWLRDSKGGLSMTSTRLAISLTKGAGHDLASINRGKLRHPVFARDAISKGAASAMAGEVVAAAAVTHCVVGPDHLEAERRADPHGIGVHEFTNNERATGATFHRFNCPN